MDRTDFYGNSDVIMSNDENMTSSTRDITSGLDVIAKVKTKMTRDSNGVLTNLLTKPVIEQGINIRKGKQNGPNDFKRFC